MKKTIVVLLSLAAAISALSACGSKEAAETQSVETQQSMTAQVEAVTEQPEPSPAADTQEPTTPPETQEAAESEPAVEEQTQEAAQAELFDACDDVVYATSTVNIRASYSTDSDKAGSLSYGQSVTRIGTGKSGTDAEKWSKVEFNGTIAYIYSDYLSTTKPVVTTSSSSGKSQSSGQSSSQSGSQTSTTGSQSDYPDSNYEQVLKDTQELDSKDEGIPMTQEQIDQLWGFETHS